MGTFFRPLRRKIGTMVLMLTCVFAAGWVRSLGEGDIIFVRDGVILTSTSGRLTISDNVQIKFTRSSPGISIRGASQTLFSSSSNVRLSATNNSTTLLRANGWTIHYWSIVIPLTLLSAWLLLSKPKQRKSLIEQQANG